MPYVNIKYIKQQVNNEQKMKLVEGVMEIVTSILERNKDFTVLTIDELDSANWFIGGNPIANKNLISRNVFYAEIKISKGTSNPEQMLAAIKAGKDLVARVMGSNDITNFFVIQELNPDAWGFDGISMTERNRLETK